MILLSVVLLSVSVAFAEQVDDTTLGGVDDEIVIDDVLSTDDDDAIVEADDSSEVNDVYAATSAVVTNSTFHDYFDDSGTLKDEVTADELIFSGDFSDIDVNYITVPKSIKLSGNGTVLKDVSFVITADNVTIDNFDITGSDVSLITLDEDISGIVISNNKINFTTIDGLNGYAIKADLIENLKILNNTFIYVGNTDGSVYNNVIRVKGDKENEETSNSILVQNNKFDIKMPSTQIIWDFDMVTYEYIQKAYSEGCVFDYCDDVQFIDNIMTIKYNNHTGSSDTIKAVSVVSSSNVVISNNEINGVGYNLIYAISVSAENFVVSNNKLNISADVYYANGISVDSNSFNGSVTNNTISVKAPLATYGIYAYQMMGPINNVTYDKNIIDAESYAACGMEIVQRDTVISNNVINAKGNYTFGIAASIRPDSYSADITNNTIVSSGSNVGITGTGDPILPTQSMGITTLGNVLIKENTINSTCIGINCVEKGNITIYDNGILVIATNENISNYAIFVNPFDEYGVAGIDSVEITDNIIVFFGKTNGPVEGDYSKTATTNAVFITTVDDVVFADNYVYINIPSVPINWVEEPAGSWNYVAYLYSEGLVFKECDGLNILENDIYLTYDGVPQGGSIYVIDVSDSDDVVIDGNDVVAVGETYLYGIVITGDDFEISDNYINLTSNYQVNGIDVEGPASGVIDDNEIIAIAPTNSYPIYGGMNYKPISLDITNNDIYGEAYYVVAVEISGQDVLVKNNIIEAKGNHTIGIGSYVGDLRVINNEIISNASNVGNDKVWDSVGTNTTGIAVKTGEACIIDNDIISTGDSAIDMNGNDGYVIYNNLIASNATGEDSIKSPGSGVISEGNKYKVIIIASDLVKTEGAADQYVVTVLDENGNPVVNKTVTATIGKTVLNATTDDKGVAKFNIDLAVGTYTVQTSFAGDGAYYSKSINNTITVNAKPAPEKKVTALTVKKATLKVKKAKKISVTLKSNGKAVAGKVITLKIKNKTFKAKTNSKGIAKIKVKLSKKGKYKATASFAGDNDYKAASKKVKITVKK